LRYSQAKIKIYGLWHALQATDFTSLVSKIFSQISKYIKGMLNNLDIQPGCCGQQMDFGIKALQSSWYMFQDTSILAQMVFHAVLFHKMIRLTRMRMQMTDWIGQMSFAIILMNSQPPGPAD